MRGVVATSPYPRLVRARETPVVFQLDDRNAGDDPERQTRCDVTRRRNRGRADRLRAVERDRVAQSAGTFRRPASQRLDGLQNAGAQVPELDHERSALLLQQVAALGRQADLQAPSDQFGTGRAQLLHETIVSFIAADRHRGAGPSSAPAHPRAMRVVDTTRTV